MKIIPVNKLRNHQLNISHSSNKFISKVSIFDVQKYITIIKHYLTMNALVVNLNTANILCLAVRNGREVDMFRIFFIKIIFHIIRLFEIKRLGFETKFFSFLENLFRSDVNNVSINSSSIVGVELNPKVHRKDVLICSFNDLPVNFYNKFDIIYFNSLDHSDDVASTIENIHKAIKNNGFLILAWGDSGFSNELAPNSGLILSDVLSYFPSSEVIFFGKNSSRWGYDEYIIRIFKN